MSKGYISDPNYIRAWELAAAEARAFMPLPGRNLIRHFGMPSCRHCWDTGLCAECLGRYPQYCPDNCGDGYCSCPAGRARRDHISSHKPRVTP